MTLVAAVCVLGIFASGVILSNARTSRTRIQDGSRLLVQNSAEVLEETVVYYNEEKESIDIGNITESLEFSKKSVAGNFDDEFYIQQIQERLLPRDLECGPQGGPTRQFAHLHHMKTGGTSLNKAIKCSLDRAQVVRHATIPYESLSECKWSHFQDCLSGKDLNCAKNINEAMVMQFCAPLFAVNHFDWLEADLVTMLRHPVDRIWSMYRFQTSSCYRCLPLLEIYQRIENGTTSEICGACESVCMTQLSNHLVRNLCTTDPATRNMTDQELLDEAIYNLKHHVALVGVTEELNTTHAMLGKVFPWLNTTIEGSNVRCDLPFANASPTNNRCGPNDTHMDLPSHPDEETVAMILKHNQLDLQLYQEGKRWFELEKIALGFTDS